MALRLHSAVTPMGDGVRDRIWKYLDDPEFGRYEPLRNALYRLLVAAEIRGASLPSAAEAKRCLDLAASAVRDRNAAVVARACMRVDELVDRLATVSGSLET